MADKVNLPQLLANILSPHWQNYFRCAIENAVVIFNCFCWGRLSLNYNLNCFYDCRKTKAIILIALLWVLTFFYAMCFVYLSSKLLLIFGA